VSEAMSVEEEEYDIQPGISSVWLGTFGILYIIGKNQFSLAGHIWHSLHYW
jgi:hypothetical protein